MAGRRYCPFEGELVPRDEMEVVNGTLIHRTEPPHRVTDGMTVHVDGDRLVIEAQAAIEAMGDAMPEDRG